MHEPVYASLPAQNADRMIQRLVTSQKVFADSIKDSNAVPLIAQLNKEREIAYPVPLTRELYNRSRLMDNVYDVMNQGKALPVRTPNLRLPALDRVQNILSKISARDEKLLMKRAEKKRVSAEEMKKAEWSDRMRWRTREGKMPGISTYSAVAIVKNKPDDGAKDLVGPLTKEATEKPNPYANA
jgi:hypothetical protein